MDTKSLEIVKSNIVQLLTIVKGLETTFSGRRFTLDDHLFGSVGEVLSTYYYGIELAPTRQKAHDGVINEKKSAD